MTFCDYLKEKYGIDEPIYIEDISFENYSRSWIFKELRKLIDKGALKRFDRGIYYFSRKTPRGESLPNVEKIIERRFLSDGNDIYGYVTGLSLLNMTALSTQVPKFLEIATNNEATRVRDMRIGYWRVRARRSRTTITKENVNVLQLLDLMNSITPAEMDDVERYMLKKFVKKLDVTKESITEYAGFFPAVSMKNMIESGVIYELA